MNKIPNAQKYQIRAHDLPTQLTSPIKRNTKPPRDFLGFLIYVFIEDYKVIELGFTEPAS